MPAVAIGISLLRRGWPLAYALYADGGRQALYVDGGSRHRPSMPTVAVGTGPLHRQWLLALLVRKVRLGQGWFMVSIHHQRN
jgi:hypothetical protein